MYYYWINNKIVLFDGFIDQNDTILFLFGKQENGRALFLSFVSFI